MLWTFIAKAIDIKLYTFVKGGDYLIRDMKAFTVRRLLPSRQGKLADNDCFCSELNLTLIQLQKKYLDELKAAGPFLQTQIKSTNTFLHLVGQNLR